jgi:serine/threonine protein kinase
MLVQQCPPEELIARFVERHALADEVEQFTTHLDSCESCRWTVSLLSEGVDLKPFADEPLERVGPYRIEGLLGAGSMGEVYAAIDERLGRRVAIKQVPRHLHSTVTQQVVLDEARGLARLNHPNIVSLFDVVESPTHVSLVMELVEGETFKDWLTRPRSVDEILGVLTQVGAGLSAAHARGVVHRDVKPANVLVGTDGRVRLSDFGLALIDGVGPGLAGTPAYMAPEQRREPSPTPAADQYAFCVLATEALTGVRPPRNATPSWPTKVPRAVRRALTRGLSTAPGDRYPSMQALVSALNPVRPWKALGLGLGLTVMALGVGVMVVAQQHRPLERSALVAMTLPKVMVVVVSSEGQPARAAAGWLVARGRQRYVVTANSVLSAGASVGLLRWRPGVPTYGPNEGGASRFLLEHQGELEGARFVRADPMRDLAVLALADAAAADQADEPATLPVGDDVMIFGHPDEALWTPTPSSLTAVRDDSLQVSLPFTSGDLGAPVIDARGRLVGVVTRPGDTPASASFVVPAAQALALVDNVSAPFVTDRSTPASTVTTCRRAFELGRAEAWLDCIDMSEHRRRHNEVYEWIFENAPLCEGQTIRYRLEQLVPDWESPEHALMETRIYYHQLFSYDPPAIKARDGSLFMNKMIGKAPEQETTVVDQLRLGAKIESVAQVSDTLAWVHLTWTAPDGQPMDDSLAVSRCGSQWCLRVVAFPEDEALLPPGFPHAVSWEAWVDAGGRATLAMWRAQLKGAGRDGWCW